LYFCLECFWLIASEVANRAIKLTFCLSHKGLIFFFSNLVFTTYWEVFAVFFLTYTHTCEITIFYTEWLLSWKHIWQQIELEYVYVDFYEGKTFKAREPTNSTLTLHVQKMPSLVIKAGTQWWTSHFISFI
jgi:hypothetical protein